MKWNELQSVWDQQQASAAEKIERENLQRSFPRKSRRLANNLFWRDLMESAAGLWVAGVFAEAAWRGGWAYWPVAVAVLLVLGVTAFFICERVRVRRRRLKDDAPLLAKLEADLDELRHQHRLLRDVARWYMAPLVAAWAITLATVSFHQPPTSRHQQLFLYGYIVCSALLFWGVWHLNRRGAKNFIAPRIAELESMRDAILSPQPPVGMRAVSSDQWPNEEVFLAKLRADRREFDLQIGKRDRRELITALAAGLVLGLSGAIAHRRGSAVIWPFVMGCGCALALALFVGVAKALAAAGRGPCDGSVLGELAQAREQTSRQIRLRRYAAWWYIVPIQAAAWLLGLGLYLNARDKAAVAPMVGLAIWTVFLGRQAITRYHLNQDEVRDQLRPRRDLLEKLMAQWRQKGSATKPGSPTG